jgi:DNA-directed RNA polymerase specialized sigma24 family protein
MEKIAMQGKRSEADGPDEVLLSRLRGGDRVALAKFILSQGKLIRARYRRQIRADARRLFDSEDLVSDVLAKLDRLVQDGALRAESASEFWSLIDVISRNIISAWGRRQKLERSASLLGVDKPELGNNTTAW